MFINEDKKEKAAEKSEKKVQHLASLAKERNENRRKILEKMNYEAAASAGRQKYQSNAYLEEQAIKRAENQERLANQQMNFNRRKRLQKEYKEVLIQQLYAKEGRNLSIKDKRDQVSQKGYN